MPAHPNWFPPSHPATPPPDALLIDSKQAAALLGISPRKLFGLTSEGVVPHRKIGRCVRYSLAELKAWVERGCPDGSPA